MSWIGTPRSGQFLFQSAGNRIYSCTYDDKTYIERHDRRTDQVVEAICATGEAVFGGTTCRGERAMRVSVCNWQTSDEDVELVVKAVAGVLGVSVVGAP